MIEGPERSRADVQRHGDLEIPEDLPFQRREWVAGASADLAADFIGFDPGALLVRWGYRSRFVGGLERNDVARVTHGCEHDLAPLGRGAEDVGAAEGSSSTRRRDFLQPCGSR
jgi:hypothetical protein